jgi:selenocysteine-specific elongation factor
MPTPAHLVVGTAGHIDHGKTSLVRALTGVDLDRLPEERARGITISLGFTWLDLPGGRRVALVDVPGHERLVRTMVAGASGMDAVLLCVSASEGVMPQTREHLDILGLLGVRRGVVALTMTDLVDEEMLELAELDVEETVAGTFLEGAPVIRTAAGPTPAGLDGLREALAALPPPTRPGGATFRLPVDRAFVQRGFGTVVTGTVRGGALADGDEVVVMPEGLKARVRGVEVHGDAATEARVGQRAALNLAGVERDDLHRGAVVMHPGAATPASILDLSYRHLPAAPPVPDGTRARLLVGTAEVMGVISIIDPGVEALEPGWRGFVQVRTDTPVVALPGDRAVLRRESPVETLGGGAVLDPWAPRARRRDRPRAHAELTRLAGGDPGVRLLRAGDAGLPPDAARVRGVTDGVRLGETLVHEERVARLEDLLLEALAAHHADQPLSPGASRRGLHRPPIGHLPAAAYDDLLARLVAAGRVVQDGPRIRLPGFEVQLDADQQRRSDAILTRVRGAGLEGPKAAEILQAEPQLTLLLLDRGELVRVRDHLLHRSALDALRGRVLDHLAANGDLSPTDFKALTGLSRRHAIPLLEWLDNQRVTVRDGDTRRAWGA